MLFDIDGTLVRCGGAGRKALNAAFEVLHGLPDALNHVRFAGSTDQVIVQIAYETVLGRAATPADIDRLLESYLEHLGAQLSPPGETFTVLPGARQLASQLAEDPRFVIGLATGNIERGARIKLEAAQLSTYFGFGGFGCDAAARAELVAAAIKRGQALAAERLGRRFGPHEILVIGDTEHDITAAHAAGAQAIGVREGSVHIAEMAAAGPELLVDSLLDPSLWSALGLSPPADGP